MDAVLTPLLNEHLASWIMMLFSFVPAFFVIRTIKETNYDDEHVVYVDDVKRHELEEGGSSSADEKASVQEAAA